MPRIIVLPLRRVVEAQDGVTIMDAARQSGLYWPTTCGGQGMCTTCTCTVDSGAGNLEPMSRSELRTLASERGEAAVRALRLRLACQAVIRGDVTVTKRGVKPVDDFNLPPD